MKRPRSSQVPEPAAARARRTRIALLLVAAIALTTAVAAWLRRRREDLAGPSSPPDPAWVAGRSPQTSPPEVTEPPSTEARPADTEQGPLDVEPAEEPADDLTRIKGIGPVLQQYLASRGITRFRQIASLSENEIDRLQEQMPGFPDRIRRDRWMEQARALQAGP